MENIQKMHTKTKEINIDKIGLILVCGYILLSYIGIDSFIPPVIQQLFLYGLLLFQIGKILLTSKFKINSFFIWYLIFILLSYVSMLYSPEQGLFNETSKLMIITLILCFCFIQNFNIKKDFVNICWTFVIASFCLFVLILVTGNLKGDESDRLGQTLFGNANIFASLIMISTLYAYWLLIYESKKIFTKILLITISLANNYMLILSGGRKFFIIPFIFLYLLLLFKADKKGKKHILLYTLLTLFFCLFVFYLIMKIDVFYNSIGIRIEGLIKSVLGEKGADASASTRANIRKLAFQGWVESPLIGHGFDSFKYLCVQETGRFYYSHCNYTELLYNGGIIYFLFYYGYFAYLLFSIIKNKTIDNKLKAFSISIIICIIIYEYGCVNYETFETLLMICFVGEINSRFKIKKEKRMVKYVKN